MRWARCHVITFALILHCAFIQTTSARGISKKLTELEKSSRFMELVGEQRVPCEMPAITPKLPTFVRAKIEQIWSTTEKSGDCWIEMAKTRNALLHLTNAEKWTILRKEARECAISAKLDGKFELEKGVNRMKRDKECWDRQKNARILLMNLPIGFKFHVPPAFECALPHFYNRLELGLQEKLHNIWIGYKKGNSCVEQIDKQIQLLEENDISLKSFQMPPPSMFRKREARRKLRRRANVA
uniref:Uncharacterized protein n=1 Tax=Caenorhabditis japonica TaxID=281687 RepID=A0A8R1IJY9_CAEJA